MNTNESPRDAEKENPDETALPRTEAFTAALPTTEHPRTERPPLLPATSQWQPHTPAPPTPEEHRGGPRVSTVVWGLLIVALAGLIIVSKLGLVALNGSYVLIGLMLGTGAALVIGGLVSAAARKTPGAQGTDNHRTPGNGSGIA